MPDKSVMNTKGKKKASLRNVPDRVPIFWMKAQVREATDWMREVVRRTRRDDIVVVVVAIIGMCFECCDQDVFRGHNP